MIQLTDLSQSDHPHFAKDLFESAFPDEERPPFGHFAIDEDLRNQGLGKAVFLNFLSQQTQQVVLEVEHPHDEISEHRIEFYASMGLYSNPQDYLQPSYHGDQVTVPMIIMTKYEIDDEEFDEIRDILYREVYKCKPSNMR